MFYPATDQQITYLEQTLVQHQLFSGHYDRLWAILEAHRIDEREPGDGTRIDRRHADEIIAWVNRQIGVDNLRPLPEQSRFVVIRGEAARRFNASVGCKHRADRNGNCVTCGAEMHPAV